MLYCPNCGAENRDTLRFCGMCGTKLAQPVTGVTAPTPSAAPIIPAGATIALGPQSTLYGQYYIVKQLGAGGMGRAYIALDTKNYNRQCIVKEMLPNWTTPEEKVEAERNFERECQLLATLSYPTGIPQIYHHFVENNNFYLVMTLIEGEDLEKRMKNSPGGRLPEKEVVKFALQVSDILIYLANRQPPVIHRDIKPANLIVDKNSGNVMLVDFGIAKATRQVGTIGGAINTASWNALKSSALGTAGYAPPEQYQGATEPRSDVYALGATLHHLLTGRNPQSAASPFDFPPVRQLAPSLSEGIERVVSHALTMNVTQRPTAAQFKTELEAIASPSTVAPAILTGPFHFRSGDSANDLQSLTQIAEAHWSDGTYHLYRGDFENWLQGQGLDKLADKTKEIRLKYADQSAGLEEFLRAVNPQLRPPVLAVDVSLLDFGGLAKGEAPTLNLQITNRGRGYLHGTLKGNVPWVVPLTKTVDCASGVSQMIQVKIDTTTLDEGAHQADALEINTNGGQQRVPAHVQITWVPTLVLKPAKRLDFGNALAGSNESLTRVLTITNGGGGVLEGTLSAQGGWFTLGADRFSLKKNEKLEVKPVASSAGLGIGVYAGTITIASNVGQTILPAELGVRKAMYDLSSRTMRWGMFAALALLSWFSCALTFGLGTRGFLGLRPINQLGAGFADMLTRFTNDPSAIADWLGFGTYLLIAFVGLIAWQIALTQNRALDEIEDFYHRRYLASEIASSHFDLWRYIALIALLIFVGIAIGFRFNTALSPTRDWLGWGLLIAPLTGAMIGGGITVIGAQARSIVNTNSGLSRFERIFFVVAGMATWGGMLGAIRKPGVPFDWFPAFVWAVVALVLVSDSIHLPMRAQWILARVRPGLLITFIAYIMEASTYALISFFRFGRASYIAVDQFYARSLVWGDAVQVVVDVMLVLAILAGALIGLAAVSDSSFQRGRTVKTVGLMLVPALFIGAIGMLIGSVLFWVLTLGHGWSLGAFLSVAAITAGAIAFFHMQAPLIERGENALKVRLVNLRKGRPLPKWATRISLAAFARDLTPAGIGILAFLTSLLEPLVVEITMSLLLVLMCLAFLAIVLGVVGFVILVTARGQTGALKRTP